MLGYSWGQPVQNSRYGRRNGHYIMDDVNCGGHERSLYECSYNSENNCNADEVAGVICRNGQPDFEALNVGATSDITHSLNLAGGITEDESGEEYLAPGTFCVAAKDEETVMAVQCKPSQVLPALLGHVYKEGERHPDYVYWPSMTNYIRYGDTDGDSLLSESEFISIVKNLLRDIFDVLDDDKDQHLEVKPTVEDPSFPFVVFEKTLKHIFKFFDLNEDNIISVNDDLRDILMPPRERFRGDVLTIGDITGSEPITWPYPFFKLYSLIDPNRDEKVTFEEALAFLTKAFLMFDRNENSYVTIMEVVNTLEINGGLPKRLVVAIEILLEKYSYLGQFIINEIVSGSGKDNDSKVSFDEIFTFDNWDLVANSLIRAALRVGYPPKGLINVLINAEYRLDHHSRRRIHSTSSVTNNWMKALLGLLNGM